MYASSQYFTIISISQKLMCTILISSHPGLPERPIMAYYKARLKNNSFKASPCLKPFLIGNKSDKRLPFRTLLYVSFGHIVVTDFSSVTICVTLFANRHLVSNCLFYVRTVFSTQFHSAIVYINSIIPILHIFIFT
jgi:hypothetical protein